MNVLYHPDKTNVVDDALNILYMGSATHFCERNERVIQKSSLDFFPRNFPYTKLDGCVIVESGYKSSFVIEVKEK